MALNRINGVEELYVGGVFGVNRAPLIQEHKITHILSVIKYSLDRANDAYRDIEHLSIDIDDMEDQDLLVHLPRMVRFIEAGLYPGCGLNHCAAEQQETTQPSSQSDADAIPPVRGLAVHSSLGAVLVHCAMGKSRSVSTVIAYLLWKHPHRFGQSNPTTTSQHAVVEALTWVRATRPVAEPNDGFMRQLELWWEMGCPADSDDAVEKHPTYQRWLYKREVEDAARVGRAPDWIRFEDEEALEEGRIAERGTADGGGDMVLRCKKCRRVLATSAFLVPHQGRGNAEWSDCPHFFIEALSWMRPILEEGMLEGRLACPNTKCAASIGRYAWQGFKCSCGDWVAPAFSLQKSKVDKVITGMGQDGGKAAATAHRMTALGIRMPPSTAAISITARSCMDTERPKENL
ncbi:Tyrosine-protein phosphatase YVH1 [Madurella mycetomatis]|uniref:protein-tyrosine-phosphatase n=1 Tax=Madurella mycetomatis TaxID=100816 RepID=A0A175VVS3_9PEZI|nr:Tyrosine-protein phosphatase YVH1 [Madurella mycetomatis]KXX79329.1 Tyrosine-protein phosphatase YVH1 [Madurella mycetomatis]